MTSINEGIQYLKDNGLNLIAIINCADLPEPTAKLMSVSGIPVADYQRLVLIGHGGRRMWEMLNGSAMKAADPIDHYSASLTQEFIHNYLPVSEALWLYPDAHCVIPLQQLGEIANWCYPSPLGSGISPEYGVWFAYRAAFLIDTDLPLIQATRLPSPCASCAEKPCISTCPADAVHAERFDIEGCAHRRLALQSPCADRCLSRLACPFKPEHRYTLDQLQYHYRHSLATLRNWYPE